MAKEFLGVGWSFPVQRGGGGSIATSRHEEDIRQAIWIVLGTSPGERVMRPDFGCGIHDLVFAVNDAGTAGRVATLVREALRRWEPRIETTSVRAEPDPGRPNTLLIDIEYRVRATNNRFNLVYPFYLQT